MILRAAAIVAVLCILAGHLLLVVLLQVVVAAVEIKPFKFEDDIVYRLRKRAEIRRQISTRKSVQEGKPDRIADLLDEAAKEIESLRDRKAI